MKNQESVGEAQNIQKKEWYKNWWGVLIVIMILPIFAIWYIWAKTTWSNKAKWITTIIVIILSMGALGSTEKTEQKPVVVKTENNVAVIDTQEIKSADTTKPEEKSIETSKGNDVILFKVSKVIDGDTLDIDMNGKTERIRLIGMDTPETVDPRKVVQCFGKEASDKAKEMLIGKMISIEADNSQGERDKYDRLLRYVYLEDGTFFNKYMIAEGYAHEYTYQSNPYKYQLDFKEAEKQARETEKGLWSPDSCNGNTTKAANVKSEDNSNSSETISPTSNNSSGSVVKKSTTGICHAPGTTYYNKTINFTPYNSIDECLKSGGRLPKK
jgi:micrococcal nuclease